MNGLTQYLHQGADLKTLEKYLQSLTKHIAAVQEAGVKLGVPKSQLEEHDLSKYSIEEFPYYAQQFHGDKNNPDGFAGAWLHHLHANPHHPEYWRFPNDSVIKTADIINRCLPMPKHYALEHIADLMGASYCYTGSWEMSEWLMGNMKKLFYHPQTAEFMREQLSMLGYKEIMATQKFGHEIDAQ